VLKQYKLENILFLDIETVPISRHFKELPKAFQTLFEEKTHTQRRDNQNIESFYEERAGLLAEFSKIICISVGIIDTKKSFRKFRIKSFYDNNEKSLLLNFTKLLNKKFSHKKTYLCAHNGKEFDFPVMARRMLINNIHIPGVLDIADKKPWEIKHLDTLDLWRFGDYKHYTSLNLLANLFGILTPKDDITGKDVKYVYWDDNDINRIVRYCQKDTLTVAQLFLRYKGENIISPENVIIT